MIRFHCPHCGKGLRTEPAMAGSAFNCPTCRGRVRVPDRDQESASADRTASKPAGAARFKVRPYVAPSLFSTRRLLWLLAGAAILALAAGITLAIAFLLLHEPLGDMVGIAAGLGALAGIALGFIVGNGPNCFRCRRRMRRQTIGVIQRDAQSAKEALEAGDLAALGALSPEGESVEISVEVCPKCGRTEAIVVDFSVPSPNTEQANRLLAQVIYPGAALPIFERLGRREKTQAKNA
jgi:hypothetical protein